MRTFRLEVQMAVDIHGYLTDEEPLDLYSLSATGYGLDIVGLLDGDV